MALASGTKLGSYQIVSPLGAGGMGEVYRARDLTLGREVAVKLLPAAFSGDSERLWRFQQEAQAAAALNHPNILVIHQVGQANGNPYIVSELLEGETLRHRLETGPLTVRKAIDYSVQIARGLAAAHEKGIVHRDLKPENIFVTRDGRIKILDFGLAKLTQPEPGAGSDLPTTPGRSEPGVVLGTVGYMAPEQVRGQAALPASDLFSFGAILYEILTSRRAFHGQSTADVMSAILKEDPADLIEVNRQVPPALDRIVRHCLEKNPEERFQSARDLAFDLQALSSVSGTAQVSHSVLPRGPKLLSVVAFGLAIAGLCAMGVFVMVRKPVRLPTYRRITFRQGTVHAARFTPDGETVVYSAALEGSPSQIFSTRPPSPESRSMGLTGSTLLAVSANREMALLLKAHPYELTFSSGILARRPLDGGAPREVMSNVESAEWAPDGMNLLVTRQSGGSDRMEFPPGRLIYENAGAMSHPRFSRQGDRIAFFDHPGHRSDSGSVAVVDLAGNKTILSTGWLDLTGLAWSPHDDEVWFTGTRDFSSAGLFAATLKGGIRQVTVVPGDLRLYDIGRNGRVLLGREDWLSGIYGLAPGESQERDLTWFDYSVASDLSSDGRSVLFWESGEGGGVNSPSFLRGTDGSPAVRLSDGTCWSFSHDAQRVICVTVDGQLNEVPTNAYEVKPLIHDQLVHATPHWLPGEKEVLFIGKEQGHGQRAYVQDVLRGKPKAVTPEGASLYYSLSPDGAQLAIAMGADYTTLIYSTRGGEPKSIPGLKPGEVPIAWSPDKRSLYCYRLGEVPTDIFRVEIATGRRSSWKNIVPRDPVGITFIPSIVMSSDLKSYVYSVDRRLDVLYLVDGLR